MLALVFRITLARLNVRCAILPDFPLLSYLDGWGNLPGGGGFAFAPCYSNLVLSAPFCF